MHLPNDGVGVDIVGVVVSVVVCLVDGAFVGAVVVVGHVVIVVDDDVHNELALQEGEGNLVSQQAKYSDCI